MTSNANPIRAEEKKSKSVRVGELLAKVRHPAFQFSAKQQNIVYDLLDALLEPEE